MGSYCPVVGSSAQCPAVYAVRVVWLMYPMVQVVVWLFLFLR